MIKGSKKWWETIAKNEGRKLGDCRYFEKQKELAQRRQEKSGIQRA